MRNKILFKIKEFPHMTETFILAQIITAIRLDFDVKILVKKLKTVECGKMPILDEYSLHNKIIIEDYEVPEKLIPKIIGSLKILIRNINHWRKIFNFYKLQRKFSLLWLFQYDFFKSFENYDVIHVQYGTSTNPMDLLKKVNLLQGRLIVSFHGHDAFFPINGYIKNNGYYKNLFVGNNIIIANTPYLEEKIKGLGCPSQNIKVVPVGVDTCYFAPALQNEEEGNKVKLITIGRLDKIKGHHVSIDFIFRLKNRKLNIELTIIGDGPERPSLKNQIKRLNLEKEVHLVGKKSQKEIKGYLRKSDIYLFTALPIENGRRETQGLATLEAQACGLPVLAFDSGGVKFTIINSKSGFICQENDIDCLEEKCLILMDKKVRERMGSFARSFVIESFDQEKLLQTWKNIYSSE